MGSNRLGTAAGSPQNALPGLPMSGAAQQQALAAGSIACSRTITFPAVLTHAMRPREAGSSQQDRIELAELTHLTCMLEAALGGLQQHVQADNGEHTPASQAIHAEGAKAAAGEEQAQPTADDCFQLLSAAADAVAAAQLSASMQVGSRAGQPKESLAKKLPRRGRRGKEQHERSGRDLHDTQPNLGEIHAMLERAQQLLRPSECLAATVNAPLLSSSSTPGAPGISGIAPESLSSMLKHFVVDIHA